MAPGSPPLDRYTRSQVIAKRYLGFRLDLPRMCASEKMDPRDLPFLDYRMLVVGWLAENQGAS
jgi:hypothetical protein